MIPKENMEPYAWPDIDAELVAYLKATFPRRCYDPANETLEEHLKYSGMVELAERIAHAYEVQVEEASEEGVAVDVLLGT